MSAHRPSQIGNHFQGARSTRKPITLPRCCTRLPILPGRKCGTDSCYRRRVRASDINAAIMSHVRTRQTLCIPLTLNFLGNNSLGISATRETLKSIHRYYGADGKARLICTRRRSPRSATPTSGQKESLLKPGNCELYFSYTTRYKNHALH